MDQNSYSEGKSRRDILDAADTVDFVEIVSLLGDFVTRFVFENRQSRWHALVNRPRQLSKKFSKLWDHLDTEQSSALQIEKLPVGDWLYYDGSIDPVYLINTKELEKVCVGRDGIAFLPDKKLAIFFTHEVTEYVFSC